MRTKIVITLCAALWLATGVIGAGFLRAAFYRGGALCGVMSVADDREDQRTAFAFIILGPATLIGGLTTVGIGYGWSLAPEMCAHHKGEDWQS
jgi:hypothetical protein